MGWLPETKRAGRGGDLKPDPTENATLQRRCGGYGPLSVFFVSAQPFDDPGADLSAWEPNIGESDEWYTPRHVFDAIGEVFDLDVASQIIPRHVHARCWLTAEDDGLRYAPFWCGFVWCNPPFGGRNGLAPWLDAFFRHGHGIALTPDRTSAPWWQDAAQRADAILFTRGKVQFERPDGTVGKSPGPGVTLWASGRRAIVALASAEANGLGSAWRRA